MIEDPIIRFAAVGQVGADNPRVGLAAFSDDSTEGDTFQIILTADAAPSDPNLMITLTLLAGVSPAERDRLTAANGGSTDWRLATAPGEGTTLDPADYVLGYVGGAEIACANRLCTVAWGSGTQLILEVRTIDDDRLESTEFLALGVVGGSSGDYETAQDPADLAGDIMSGTEGGIAPPAADAVIAVADVSGAYRRLQTGADLRAGRELSNVRIRADEYAAPNGEPGIHIQRLTYAHLGLWLVDFTFDDNKDGRNWHSRGDAGDDQDDGLEIVYHLLDDNRVSNLPSSGTATYALEADIVYKGERFFPDTSHSSSTGLTADFGAATISGRLFMNIGTPNHVSNSIGGSCSTLGIDCQLSSGARAESSPLRLEFSNGAIAGDGTFSGEVSADSFSTSGHFLDLAGQTGGTFSGAFFDADTYDPTTDGNPAEVGGTFSITDPNGQKLQGGFLGAEEE